MPDSVLEAIKLGVWNFEPKSVPEKNFSETEAIPGSREKLSILAQRIEAGLPLWHSRDKCAREDELEA